MPPVSSPPLAGITTTGRSIYQTRQSRASHFHGFITRRTAVVGNHNAHDSSEGGQAVGMGADEDAALGGCGGESSS